MEEGSSAQDYVNTFESLISEAATLDLGLDKMPELLALFFLLGLPKSLETFTQYLTISHADEAGQQLTPRYVTTALINHVRTKTTRLETHSGENDIAMRVDKAKAKCHACGKKGFGKLNRRLWKDLGFIDGVSLMRLLLLLFSIIGTLRS